MEHYTCGDEHDQSEPCSHLIIDHCCHSHTHNTHTHTQTDTHTHTHAQNKHTHSHPDRMTQHPELLGESNAGSPLESKSTTTIETPGISSFFFFLAHRCFIQCSRPNSLHPTHLSPQRNSLKVPFKRAELQPKSSPTQAGHEK